MTGQNKRNHDHKSICLSKCFMAFIITTIISEMEVKMMQTNANLSTLEKGIEIT